MSFGKHARHTASAMKGIATIILTHRIAVRDMLFLPSTDNVQVMFVLLYCALLLFF